VISAHWEEPEFTVTTSRTPPLLFDYYGFPEHTYRLRYDAPGSPELARDVRELLAKAGITSKEDAERGFDHGVFIPFLLIYPDADIPIVQLSLKAGLDPAEHIAAGRALAPLRDRNVLIVGSGMSYHNMEAFRRGLPPTASGTSTPG
jgi:aromatic ring-opening dioxygenase catalytic subunit (LigB family)